MTKELLAVPETAEGAAGSSPRSPSAEEDATLKEMAEKQLKRSRDRQILMTTRRIAEFSPGKSPSPDDIVVYVAGSFDMFHAGYASFLKEAKKLGTYLLVGVHDDATVNEREGSNYPVQTMHERVLNVCACKHVDEVIMGAPGDITDDLINTMDIKYVVHGRRGAPDEESTPIEEQERYKVAVDQGILKVVDVSKWDFLSPEVIADRVLTNRRLYMNRNAKRGQTEDEYYANKQKEKGVHQEQ